MKTNRFLRAFPCLIFILALFLAFNKTGSAVFQDSPDSSNQAATTEEQSNGQSEENKTPADTSAVSAKKPVETFGMYPLIVLAIGIATVLGLIIIFKVNAFIALISAAIIVSLLAPGDIGDKIGRVAKEFGNSAGGIGIVIALAAVIGKCMLDSGAADRIVRMFLRLLGEKRAPMALMGSGFVLAVPVFFDTVFYLLVPLARSLHRKTGKHYLTYILAIAAGGAITHTLVPPTPGPLLMAANLGIDVGLMILIGAIVALPSAFAGLYFGKFCDGLMKTPMREIGGKPEPQPLSDDQLPPLWLSLAPVLLPVLLISASTVANTLADSKQPAVLHVADIKDWDGFPQQLKADNEAERENVGKLILSHPAMASVKESLLAADGMSEEQRDAVISSLNRLIRDKEFYDEKAFLGTLIKSYAKSKVGTDLTRMKVVDVERMNRQLLESAYPQYVSEHNWDLPSRKVANTFNLFGNANLALLISAIIAMITLFYQRDMSLKGLSTVVEESLMSGGVIILITAGGGAFGAMLKDANVGPAIQEMFSKSGEQGFSSVYAYLLLGFVIAMVLKIAQGSSTVAMIVGSAMMAAIVNGADIGCNYVYLATAIGAGSLVGSWMNDSGFWIFAKMGGLTEVEALKSWTIMLGVLGIISMLTTMLLVTVMPL